jgi:ABC-type uncharacterized transport system substrate-binding protein
MRTTCVRGRVVALLLGGLCLTGSVMAHPHGSIECKAQVRYEAGHLQDVRGELLLDAWHSQQAIALLRDAAGQVDAQRLQRFVFALKMQLGRLNWLFDMQADGQSLTMKPKSDPTVDIVDERIRIAIDYAPDPVSATRWSLHCADPTYYYVTAFGNTAAVAPPSGVPVTEVDPTQVAAKLLQIGVVQSDPAAVKIQGCTHIQLGAVDEKSGPPRAGMARMDWLCQP